VTYTTLACAVDGLTRRGFTQDFRAIDGRLRALGAGQTFAAADLVIREFHRFEGVSDPDDMAILYAIESTDGTRGSLVDAFGAYSNPTVSAFLHDVPIGRAPEGDVSTRSAG
jgi:hypothetical protein